MVLLKKKLPNFPNNKNNLCFKLSNINPHHRTSKCYLITNIYFNTINKLENDLSFYFNLKCPVFKKYHRNVKFFQINFKNYCL